MAENRVYNGIITKLVNLHPEVTKLREIIEKIIGQYAILAGGSILYGMDIVDSPPNDLDFFVMSSGPHDPGQSWKIDNLIQYVMKTLEQYEPLIALYPADSKVRNAHLVSVVNIVFMKLPKLVIQFVDSQYGNPLAILENFDFDYVQCGVYNGKLLITNECAMSHAQRKISTMTINDVSNKRVVKALNKGFSMPFLSDKVDETITFTINDDLPVDNNVLEYYTSKSSRVVTFNDFQIWYKFHPFADSRHYYIADDKLPKPISIDQAKITSIVPSKTEFMTLISVKNEEFSFTETRHPYNWVVTNNGIDIVKRFVSIALKVKRIDVSNKGRESARVNVHCDDFFELKIEHAELDVNARLPRVVTDVAVDDELVAIAEVYCIPAEGNYPRLRIVALYPRNATPIKPFEFDIAAFSKATRALREPIAKSARPEVVKCPLSKGGALLLRPVYHDSDDFE